MTFTILKDRQLIRRGGGSNRYLLAHIEAPLSESAEERTPVNIALVIDRSGSMAGEKLAHAIDAACYAIGRLQPTDRFAVVAYDNEVRVVVPSTPATAEACADAELRIRRITRRGSTDLCQGWLHGCQQIAEYLDDEDIGRCFLLTDGLANQGITNHDQIVEHAANLRRRNVVTSTFGIGANFDEDLLDRMARAGGGNFYFIGSGAEIPGYIDQEVGETLEIVARDAVLHVEAPSGCEVESLNDFPIERSAGGWQVLLGSLTSGQEIEPLLRVRFPRGYSGATAPVTLSLSARNERISGGPERLAFTYAPGRDNDTQPREQRVDRQVAKIYAARARRRAAILNGERDYDGALAAIEACARRIRGYAGDDPDLQATLAQLLADRSMMARRMDEMSRKTVFRTSSSVVRERGTTGFAKRRGRGQGLLILPTTGSLLDITKRAKRALAAPFSRVLPRLDVADEFNSAFECLLDGRGPIGPLDELRLAAAGGKLGRDYGATLLFIDRPFDNNWFSHWHSGQRTALITTAGLSEVCMLNPLAYVAQEIVMHGLHALSPAFDLEAIFHQETRGCMFDFCGDKRDLEVKLETMDVCGDCRTKLERMRIEPALVMELCAVVRGLSAGQRGAA